MLRVEPRRSRSILPVLALLVALPLALAPATAREPSMGEALEPTPPAAAIALGAGPPPTKTYTCRGDAPFDGCLAGPYPLKSLEITMRRWGYVGTLHAIATHAETDQVLARLSCTSHGIWVSAPGPSECRTWHAEPFPAGRYFFSVSYDMPTVGSFDVAFRYG
ncbi:MAG TPA: hypothetical protein VM889_12830 [Candidatus Thermoplasmatota archaeon]|nr:hypothetical protein [Candidatus Thermoplasmatota archaeon]